MGGFIRKIFWGTPVRKVLSVLTVLFFLPAWVFNYENWLSENGYDKLLTDSESPLLKGLGALAAFLLSSEPRWFLAGAMVALVAEGIWRFRSSRAENINAPLAEGGRAPKPSDAPLRKERGSDWALGLQALSAKDAACAFAGISSDQYKFSPKAKAIFNQIKHSVESGLILTSEHLEKIQSQNGPISFVWIDRNGRNLERYDVSYNTMLPTSELSKYFKNMPWDHSWIVKESSCSPQSPLSIEPETQP